MNNNNMGMNGINNNNMGMYEMNNNNMGMNRINNNNMGMNRMNNNMGMNGMNNNMGMNGMNNNMGMNGMNNNNMGMNRMNNNNMGMYEMSNNKMGMNGMNNNNMGMNRMNNNNMGMNEINNNNMNMKYFLMENIFKECQNIKDPYEIQKNIVKKMNLEKECPVYLNNNAQKISFFTSSSVENNNNKNCNLINIHFVTMKGNSHIKQYNKFMKIRDMLEDFVISFGLSKDALRRIQFLYNATNLYKLEDNLTLDEFNICDHCRINVVDMFDVIGA